MIQEWKTAFYVYMVICFLGAGVCEFLGGNYRMGMASVLLGVVQALLFLGGRE